MFTSSILEAGRLNHEAANCIRNGQYDDAISSITRGMTVLKQALPLCTSSGDEDMDGTSEMSCSCCEEHELDIDDVYFMDDSEPSSSKESWDSEGLQDFVFRRAILLNIDDYDVCYALTAVKLSAIMMFNLALCQHLAATRCPGATDYGKLQAAMLLYENAYLIQQSEEFEICPLYDLALSNNLGQVHRAMGHDEEASECFKQLLSILVYLVACCDDFEGDQLEGFFRNTTPLMFQSCPVAAAA